MNSQRDLLGRALELFPVKVVKDHFKMAFHEVLAKNTPEQVYNFVYNNLDYTKQHIFVFKIKKPFNSTKFNELEFPLTLISHSNTPNGQKLVCYRLIGYKSMLMDPIENVTLKFLQPITITFHGTMLYVQTTILEKSLKSFGHRPILRSERDVTELDIINELRTFFTPYYDISICDINKGVKALWSSGIIDSRKVQWKKNLSTATETMDGEMTLREEYPDLYKELMKGPLNKTIFKYIKGDGEIMDHFTTNPSFGEINVVTYPKNPNQIKNVIDAIISGN